MGIGFECDDTSQQAFHFLKFSKLFCHHGLVVNQVRVVRRFGDAAGEQVISQLVFLEVSEQADLSDELEPGITGIAFGQTPNKLSSFLKFALRCKYGRPAGLRLHHLFGVVYFVKPGIRGSKILALLGNLGQRQVGLCQSAVGFFVIAG